MLGVGLLGIGLVNILDQLGWVWSQSTRRVVAVLAAVAILGVTALPITAGMAILKYRLYEIDRIINRTLVYGLLTVLLAAVYAGLVLSIGQLSGAIGTEPPSWAVAGATLAVAALFQPARRRIQQTVDAASTAAATTRPGQSRRSAPDSVTNSTSIRSLLKWWPWPTRRWNQP